MRRFACSQVGWCLSIALKVSLCLVTGWQAIQGVSCPVLRGICSQLPATQNWISGLFPVAQASVRLATGNTPPPLAGAGWLLCGNAELGPQDMSSKQLPAW